MRRTPDTAKFAGAVRTVLLVCSEDQGGVAEHVRLLARGLGHRGRPMLVAGPAGLDFLEPGDPESVRFEPVPITGAMFATQSDARTIWMVRSLIRRENVGLVHGIGQKGGVVARAASLMTGSAAVYTPSGFGYRTQLLRPRRGARLRRSAVLAIERRLGRITDLLVACCEDERRAAIVDRVIASDRAVTVHYGVEPDAVIEPDRALRDFAGVEPLVGFVTGLREQKGLPLLFDALDILRRDGRLPRVAIVGNGPLAPYVEQRIADGHFAGRVERFPYQVPMARYLRALDVFVHPSYWEGLPIAVLEAMAFGLPVVATAVNGVPEAIEHDRSGLLVAPNDAMALATAIARIVGDGHLRARLGAEARLEVERRFELARMLDGYAGVYDQLLSHASRRPWRRTHS